MGPLAARIRRWLVVLVVLVGSLVPRNASAEAFDLNDASWEGCANLLELARSELGSDRVVVLSTLDWEQVKASDGVLVLHPTEPLDAEEAAAFMKAGGRMAVLDDYGKGDRLLSHFKIRRRALPTDPSRYLRSKPQLPIATPAFDTSGGDVLGLHPTVADVKQVVLNHGTGLVHPDLTPVLEVRVRGGDPVAVAVAGQIEGEESKGRLFAMGDPSAFINQMLRYPGNRAFASGLVHYLADGDATEARRGRLFIVANEFGEKGSFGGVTPLRKSVDRKINAALEALEELRSDGFPWWLHVCVAGAGAALQQPGAALRHAGAAGGAGRCRGARRGARVIRLTTRAGAARSAQRLLRDAGGAPRHAGHDPTGEPHRRRVCALQGHGGE